MLKQLTTALVCVCTLSNVASAQVDNLTAVVDARPLIGSKKLGGYAYDPSSDSMFVFAAGADFGVSGNPGILKLSNVGSSPTSQVMLSLAQISDYYTDNNGNLVTNLGEFFGFLLNPKPIGNTPAYSMAMITDSTLVRTANGTSLPDMSKRLYAYNLQAAPVGMDGRDVFTTRVTLADMQMAASKTTTSSSVQRQFAWSGDGQSVYFVDSSNGFGGLWKVGAVAGAARQMVTADMENTEPGVFSAGGIDRIYVAGLSGTVGAGNSGGIDFITHDGTTTSAPQVALGVHKLLDFFELSGTMSSQRVSSIAFDGSDMYFGLFNTNSDSKKGLQGIYRMDATGRLSKVANRTERTAAFGNNVSQTFDRFQPRTITFTGTQGSFPVTQVLYREQGVNTVAGATAFKPVDFNRDNQVTAADLTLFAPQVTIRGQLKTNVADLKFDMNGNDTVDWKDVQIVEGFLNYVADPALAGRIVPTLPIQADADLNGVVDFTDFQVMQGNYGTTSQGFTQGDYNGDNEVSFPDLQPWINSYGFRSAVIGAGVPMAAFDQAVWNQFLAGLTPQPLTLPVSSGRQTQFQAGYRTIVIASSVTKTGTGTLVFDGANTYTGPTVVSAGTLELTEPAAVATSTLQVAAGAKATVAARMMATAGGLDLTGGGLVDVTSGGMTVASGLSTAELVDRLVAGRGDGSWNGTSGITSSTAAAELASSNPRAVGWLDNGDGSMTFAYAAPGDTNVDWSVDVLDAGNFLTFGKFDAGLLATWQEGDFNYDGVVDVLDASDFFSTGLYDAGNYNTAPGMVNGGVAAVPEPGMSAIAVVAAIALACRHRRQAATVA
jgi:autotransporter-associated beta strand protein